MELTVGCRTNMPDGYDDRYFNIEVYGTDMDDNRLNEDDEQEINLHYLKEDIQGIAAEIVDDIVYLMDNNGNMIWELVE